MANEGLEYAIEWLTRVDNDWRSARVLIDIENPPTDSAAFHCQQAVEKLLKAYLVYHNEPFEKVHLLAALCGMCAKIDGDFDGLIQRVAPLTRYAVRFRYPGVGLPTVEDVHEALTVVDEAVAFVMKRLPDAASKVIGHQ